MSGPQFSIFNSQFSIPSILLIGSIFLTFVLAVETSLRQTMPADVTETETGSGAMATESGSALEGPRCLSEEERRERIYGFILRARSRMKTIQAYRNQDQLRTQKRIQHQLECQSEMRRANRDTKLPTMLRCYRAQLTLNLESLRKEHAHLNDLPGASTEAREKSATAINALTDAITTVINGIDAGVYTSEKGLQEAKKNLTELYRKPYWRASAQINADGILTWSAYFISEIENATREIESPDEEENLLNAKTCLEDGELRLVSAIAATEYEDAKEKLDEAYAQLQTCLDILKPTLEEKSKEAEEEEEATNPADEHLPGRMRQRIRY